MIKQKYKQTLLLTNMLLMLGLSIIIRHTQTINHELQIVVDEQHTLITEQMSTISSLLQIVKKSTQFNVPGQAYESISHWAQAFDLNLDFMLALAKHESNFYQWKQGIHDEVGIMQIRLIAARDIIPDITEGELWEMDTNIMIGCNYFRTLLDRYNGDYRLAATAYNRGPGSVDLAIRRGNDPTNGYYRRVATIARFSQ